MLVKIFGASSNGDTPVIMSQCGEGGFYVALGESVGYHSKTFKEVINIGVYIKGRHESIYVAVGRFLVMTFACVLPILALLRHLLAK